jgi:lipopolysaccharide/colanic/teichoic acid biosynthesis glycosyltransferase
MSQDIAPAVKHEGDGASVAIQHPETIALVSTPIPSHKITQQPQSLSRLWYLLGLPFVLGISLYFASGDPALDVLRDGWVAFTAFAAAYTAAWGLAAGFERFPSVDQSDVALFALGIALIPMAVGLLLSPIYQLPYFITTALVLCVVWFFGSVLFFGGKTRSRLVVVPGGIARALTETTKVEYSGHSGDETITNSADGIVADLHQASVNGYSALLERSGLRGLPIYHAAFIYEMLTGRVLLKAACEHSASGRPTSPVYQFVKRGIDVFLVLVSLPLTVPLMLFTALAIWLESPGSVLFAQERVGRGGKTFHMIKFRSMCLDAEKDGAQFAGKEDPRITRVGKFIRKFRVDELPQFWNVLKGEMSLIGPRPEQVGFVNQFNEEIQHYAHRHSVRPGITGWAQVRNGYAADSEETRRKLSYDLYYVKHCSFILDLLIICLTIKTILTGFGSR